MCYSLYGVVFTAVFIKQAASGEWGVFDRCEKSRPAVASERKEASVDGWASNFLL